MKAALRELLAGVFVLVALIGLVSLLAGCGGGDPEPDQANPAVNCALQPVVCR